MLGYGALEGVLSMADAISLLEEAARHDAAGRTALSPKYNMDFENGSMRMLVAADHEAGYLATKAYHTIQGVGVRYIVTLYRLRDGEPLATLDGQLITDLRTGAASGVVARKVPITGPVSVGIIGSGNQARTQLESLCTVYRVQSAEVYSPTAANRERYARAMSAKLGIPVSGAASAEDAVRGRTVVVTATSARTTEPLVHGEWLSQCRLLCAVGNTRSQYAEVDADCFRNAELVIADSQHAWEEAGDLRRALASGAVAQGKRVTLAQIVTGAAAVPPSGLVAFKSVGTALQDLALAARYYELLGAGADMPTMPQDLGRLRPSARASR